MTLYDHPHDGHAKHAGAAEIRVKALVFTSPTEAWFRYDVHASSIEFPDRSGVAHKSAEGNCQLTRAAIRQDLALAPGAECDPTVELVLPPSAENDPRFNPHDDENHPIPWRHVGAGRRRLTDRRVPGPWCRAAISSIRRTEPRRPWRRTTSG